ncbi:MAG: hypothetical protein H5T97_06010 [Firmicutes bacterium]|nr:hypothetical protein [Bacillota bacterium]
MSAICALIDRLATHGVTVRLVGDKIRVRRPDPVPPELEGLLAELKARRDEVVAYLRGREEGSTQPHPGDCVCLDCLSQHLFRESAGPDSLLPEPHPGPGPAPVDLPPSLRPHGTCFACGGSRWWVSVRGAVVCGTCHPPPDPSLVARWVETEAEPGVSGPVPPGLAYVRGRVAGTIPPPEHPPKEPYRYTLPAGVPDPMDYRWNPERQEWVLEPGWWRELPGKGVH